MRKIMSVLICISILLCMAGCQTAGAEGTVPVTLPLADEVVFATEPVFTTDRDPGKVCLQLLPTDMTATGGCFYYFTPEDQELWVQEFEAAIEKADYEKHWQQGDSSTGIWIMYQDEEWELLASGELQADELGRVSAEDAEPLRDLCMAALEDLKLSEPVRPDQIQNIQSATLEYHGTYTITDAGKLDTLENWLSDSSEMRGGTNCPFEARLTLTLESGEELTLSLATDSCCTWMSEGVFYKFGSSDNEEFFSFFTEE